MCAFEVAFLSKTKSDLIFPTVQSVGREAVQRTRGTQGGVEEGRPTVEVERPTFEQHRDPHLRSRRQQRLGHS